MEPRRNPYAPGAGTPPPELAGRSDLLERAAIALDRIRGGKPARSFVFYGLRGVGKTVLLAKLRKDAQARGFSCVWIEAPEGRSLPSLLVPSLRGTLLKLNPPGALKSTVGRALKALFSFAKVMKVKYEDIEFGFDATPERGLADSGDLESDLADLLGAVGEAAAERGTAVVLFLDELQYVPEEQLAALIMALHRAAQNEIPITVVAAGLPQLVGQTGRAKSYAERLLEFAQVDSLDEKAAREALCLPAEKEGANYEEAAIRSILGETKGYPYFLQEWGKHSWNSAEGPTIRKADAEHASKIALAELDASFFHVRFDRLTPAEKRYMRAMAELGPGPHRSGDIAEKLGRKVQTVAPLRNTLIYKGMIFSPAHGDTAFTVPLFDGFMKRIMPKL